MLHGGWVFKDTMVCVGVWVCTEAAEVHRPWLCLVEGPGAAGVHRPWLCLVEGPDAVHLRLRRDVQMWACRMAWQAASMTPLPCPPVRQCTRWQLWSLSLKSVVTHDHVCPSRVYCTMTSVVTPCGMTRVVAFRCRAHHVHHRACVSCIYLSGSDVLDGW